MSSKIIPPQGGTGVVLPQGHSSNYPAPQEPRNSWDVYKCPVTALYFDPFGVYSSLQYYAGGIDKLNELIRGQSDPAVAIRLVSVGRKVFRLPPLDPITGAGYPDAVVLGVIDEYARYVRGKGNGAGKWRNWLRPPESPASSAPVSCSVCG